MIHWCLYSSPIGKLYLAEADGNLTGLWMENQKYFPEALPEWMQAETPVLLHAKDWLDRYFSGCCPSPGELPLSPRGSPFRQEVWQLLMQIPYGSVTTYAALAVRYAELHGLPRMSAQAVGGAVGHNPLSILIPCHRVVAVNGSLTGYAGGLERKQWLLRHEGFLNETPTR